MPEAKKTIYKRLLEAQKNFKPAIKDANNPFFKSSYADLSGVWEACRDALHEQGLFVSQGVGYENGNNTLNTRVYDEDGAFIESTMLIQQKEANNMQSLGSGITYARRYALASILGIITEDDDGNASVGKTVKPAVKVTEPKPEVKPEVKSEPVRDATKFISHAQHGRIAGLYTAKNLNRDEMRKKMAEMFRVTSHKDLTVDQAGKWIEYLLSLPDKEEVVDLTELNGEL